MLGEGDINSDTEISLREAVIKESISGEQGFVKCSCNGKKNAKQTDVNVSNLNSYAIIDAIVALIVQTSSLNE